MAQNMPWSLKGIDPSIRDAAREAARRSGMSVGEWLESVIREQAAGAEDADEGPARDLQGRLDRLARSSGRAAMERAAPDHRSVADIEALVTHAARLDARTRETETKTTTALESILGWIERAEGRMAAAEREAAQRQERATSVIADAIKTVSSRVADVERRAAHPATLAAQQPAMAAGERRAAPRLAFSRDTLASAVSDIRSRRQALDAGGSAAVAMADGTTGAAHWPHVERRAGPRDPAVTPVMNSIRHDISRLREEIAGIARQPASSSLEDSIRDLARKLDQREAAREQALAPDEIARPLARIEAEMARLQSGQGDERFTRVEREIGRLGDRIETLAATAGEPRLLAAAVDELAALKQQFARAGDAKPFDALSGQIAALAGDMGRVREEIARSGGRGDIEAALRDMREALARDSQQAGIGHGLMQRIAQQLETVASAVGALANGAMNEDDRAEIAGLSRKLDQLAQRTQPESDVLARRIESLAIKLEDLSRIGSTELLDRVDRLSEQLEVLTTRGPVAIEKQIDTLAARIETLANSHKLEAVTQGAPFVDLSPIESMIGDLARKMDEASRPDAGHHSLQALESQIAALSSRLDEQPARPSAADGLESTLQDLMRYLGGLREETTTAVDRAARAAVADAIGQAPAPAKGAEEFAVLRQDLAGLRDVHSSIDQRTHQAISAVNDTLEKIVSRLAQLEDDFSHGKPVARVPAQTDLAGFAAAPESFPPQRPEPAPRAARPLPRAIAAQEERATSSAAPPETIREPALSATRPAAAAILTGGGAPDLPLEPGSGRPRAMQGAASALAAPTPSASVPAAPVPPAAAPAAPPASSLNPNLIAAARRAAQAASAETQNLRAEAAGKPAKAKGPKLSMPISLRETLDKRRKPILLGLAAIVLALGAGQVATTLLSEPSPQVAPARTDGARQTGEAPAPAQSPAAQAPTGSGQPPAPASAMPRDPQPRDQQSLAAPEPARPDPRADMTSSVRTAPADTATLPQTAAPSAPAPAAAEPSNAAPLAPGRVSNLGEVPTNLGTPGLRRAAQEGDASAVYELAARAADGPTRDPRLALRLFERAAAAGLTPAQFRLGNIYEKGIGAPRDAKLAVTWYKRAAERGNAKAMHNLAVLIAEGADGRPDYAAAAELFRKAAEFGVRDSQYNLAILLGRGLGVEQDLTQSYAWFAIAARGGDTDAAKKRDEVGAKLTGTDMAAANALTLAWKPKTPDPIANEIVAPADGWDPVAKPAPARPAQPRPRGA